MSLSKIVADSIAANTVTVTNIADNTITSAKLTTTGVESNTYGNSTFISVIGVDAAGRVTNATTASIQTHLDTAYSNAVTVANTTSFNQAANAYANAVSVANTTSYNQAANAYANATSYADAKAANAYANVFNGGTFTGVVTMQANLTANTVRLNGSMQIDGDLIVAGNTVTMNVTSLAVEDNMIYLNSSSNVANPDIGIAGNYNDGTYRHTGVFRDATDGNWKFFHQYVPEPDASAYIDTSNNTFALANVQANTFIGALSGNASIAAGNSVITGTLTVNGAATFANSTANVVYVAANGFVGISNNTPASKLHITHDSTFVLQLDRANNTPHVKFNNTSDSNNYGLLYADYNAVTLQSRYANSSTRNVWFYGDASGNVGIGTTAPTSKLDITGPGTSSGVTLRLNDSSSSADSRHIFITRGSSNAIFGVAGSQANDPLWISRTGGYDVMVSSTGALMLNTTSDPNISNTSSVVKLLVNGDQHFSRQSAKIYFGDVTSTTPLSIGEGLQGDGGTDKDFMSLYGRNNIRFFTYTYGDSTTETEYMRLSSQSIAFMGEPYSTYVKSWPTPDGGSQNVRFIEDNLGRWILVGRFAADASVNIGGTWNTVRGLSTSTSQSQATEFSADWGSSYPTEVRILGSTDFDFWKPNRTIDFVYRVPANMQWKNFFNGGQANGTYQTTGTVRYGFYVSGGYDGFGRWNNPALSQIGMSDGAYNNPDTAYTTPTSGINWNTANDAKLTTIHTGAYSGQDITETTGFGYDDNVRGFFDSYPSTSSNMGGGTTFSSAVWVLIKLN